MGELISKVRDERLSSFEGLQLTDKTYNLAIGLTLIIGILVDLAIAHYLSDAVLRMNPILMLVIYLAGSFGCTFVIYRSAKPVVSFLGFLGLSVCMGLLLTYFLTMYDIASIQLAVKNSNTIKNPGRRSICSRTSGLQQADSAVYSIGRNRRHDNAPATLHVREFSIRRHIMHSLTRLKLFTVCLICLRLLSSSVVGILTPFAYYVNRLYFNKTVFFFVQFDFRIPIFSTSSNA